MDAVLKELVDAVRHLFQTQQALLDQVKPLGDAREFGIFVYCHAPPYFGLFVLERMAGRAEPASCLRAGALPANEAISSRCGPRQQPRTGAFHATVLGSLLVGASAGNQRPVGFTSSKSETSPTRPALIAAPRWGV